MKAPARKGRPRKNAITKLKVMAWFTAVAQASKKTAAELEREFADPNYIRWSKEKNKEIRPGLWDKYRRGEIEPRGRPSKGKSISAVQAVEVKYPGTAKVLALPLWNLLDLSQPMAMEELNLIQKNIGTEVQHLQGRENVLLDGLSEASQTVLTELLSADFDSAINQLTINALSLRRAMLLQQESLIGLMQASLIALRPRYKVKKDSRKTRKKIQKTIPNIQIKPIRLKQ